MSATFDSGALRSFYRKAPPPASLACWMLLGAGMLSQLADEGKAFAAPEWFLFSRHGECAEIVVLKRKIPDLVEIHDPQAFAQFMLNKGYQVTMNKVSTPMGSAVQIRVPEQELTLMFVTASTCRQTKGG